MSRAPKWLALVLGLLAPLAAPGGLLAQAAEPLSAQKLGRPYLFMFIAYALVLGVIAGWVISIAVRQARIDKQLKGQ